MTDLTLSQTNETSPVWQYPAAVVIATTVVTSAVTLAGLLLNAVLVMTIQCSPSLKTPPNSHLLNICLNNLVLGVHALLALPSLHLNGVHVHSKGSEVLSGLQLFLLMHCLLQYWGAFASIGYYRFRTIHHPSLSLRVRKLIVSRAITTSWIISLLLAMTFSLTSAQASVYLPCTLDPFRCSFYLDTPKTPNTDERGSGEELGDMMWPQDSELVVVMALVVVVLLLGLLVILASYYSICRTLNVAGRMGKTRISPWPPTSPSLPSLPSLPSPPPITSLARPVHVPVSDAGDASSNRAAVASGGRSYRPEPEGQLFCVTGPQGSGFEATWIVHYQKLDHGDFIDDLLTLEKAGHVMHSSRSASSRRELYASKRPLGATLSNGSTTSSVKTSTSNCPDFSDISLGADIVRLQKLRCSSALKKQSVRRERGSLSNASKNSLVMLIIYLCCSLPLIVCQVPGSLKKLAPDQRVMVLLACRVVFLLNSPIYPLWYLVFSVRVKKCLTRMCDTLLLRFHHR
ncbi:uncharacterized protein [Littorina saxatilis]|uniref:uncharacterized protein n=1 Tax=Littorina saxatilis TaxID=31220 RepID=UPI0038B477B8